VRKKLTKGLRLAGLVVVSANLGTAAADELELFTENSAPNNYLAEDGKTVIGTATQTVKVP